MIRLLFLNALRSIGKQMPYSFVNVLGMTIGVASVLMVLIWIAVETSYDKFHTDHERLYRVNLILKTPNKEINSPVINAPAGPEYKREFPVIENSVRFEVNSLSAIYNDKITKLQVFYTDSTFFDLFTFELSEGDKKSCLESSQGIVLTEKAAKKVFGSEDPIGKGVMIGGNTFIVTAIAKNPPVNTNLQFECLAPLSIREKEAHVGWDGGLACYTYVRLIKGADPKALEKQILEYMEGVINKRYREYGYALIPYLEKISDIHLNSETNDTEVDDELGGKGSKTKVFIISGIGLLVLLIACFNFVNINTAISFQRAKEVSLKKIFGSDRKNIIIFFILESGIAIIISLLMAFLLARIFLPGVSNMIGKSLSVSVIGPELWLLIFVILFVFCTVFASFYSSFYLSSVNPLALLSSENSGLRKQFSRNILVTFQFTISIALIISCLVIYSQMQFVKKSDKGFEEENILYVNLSSKTSASYELIAGRLLTNPGVVSVAVSAGGKPGIGFTSNGYMPEGFQQPVMANALYVDENWLKTMEITLIEGRDFRNRRVDPNKAIINQTFAEINGWDKPVGKTITRNDIKYEVIGLVRDFNTDSFYENIQPLFISTVNEWGPYQNIIIKIQPDRASEVLKFTELMLKEIDPKNVFEYEFLEDSLRYSYASDHKLNILFLVLAVIAIFISSLGLFGLATYNTQSRVKEISIRKVNGAMISDILWKFNFELLKWILVSFVIAGIIGYFVMNRWLNNFAYKTTISVWTFIFSGLLAIIIGLLTVSLAANKASRANPAEILRKN
ncbi:MAG TPA: ABC transporter permease [Bacteroidales bacterium]|nr:ABC transporter permease [Bacteroidales bacterium]